jgi:hypothetical protein
LAVVTRLGNRPGFVVVTRTLKEPDAAAAAKPGTVSVLLDGRQTDRWRIVDVKSSPGELSVEKAVPAIATMAVH